MATPNRMIDIHAHILPGIDDGAETLGDSIKVIDEMVRNGVTDIIATPHFVDETAYVSPRSENLKLLKEVENALEEENIKVNLYLGNEIYINDKIIQLIKEKKISSLAGSKYLLVELPLDGEFPNYEEYFQDLINHGVKVILAHPERYAIIQKDYEIAMRLHKMGLIFQCNLGSITGKYGNGAKKLVKKLAKDKMIYTFSSDIHHCRGDKYWQKSFQKLKKYYSKNELASLLVTNPGRIISSCK